MCFSDLLTDHHFHLEPIVDEKYKMYWIFFVSQLDFFIIFFSPQNISGMQKMPSRPRRVKFQLGNQILLCGRPVGD